MYSCHRLVLSFSTWNVVGSVKLGGGRLNGKYMQALFWLFHSYTINSTWGLISMCVLFVLFSSHRGHRGQQCCCGDCCSGDKHHCICCRSPGWSSDVPLHQQAPFTVQTWFIKSPTAADRSRVWRSACHHWKERIWTESKCGIWTFTSLICYFYFLLHVFLCMKFLLNVFIHQLATF